MTKIYERFFLSKATQSLAKDTDLEYEIVTVQTGQYKGLSLSVVRANILPSGALGTHPLVGLAANS